MRRLEAAKAALTTKTKLIMLLPFDYDYDAIDDPNDPLIRRPDLTSSYTDTDNPATDDDCATPT